MSSVTQIPHYFAGRSPGPDLAPFESPHSEHASAPISRPCPIAVPQSFQHESHHALEESQDLYNDQISKEKALCHPPVSQTLSQPRTPDAPQALDRRKEICKGSIEKTDTTSRHSFSSPGISRSTSDPEKQCHPRYPVRFDVEYLGSPDLYSTVTFMRDELRDEETILKQHATKILVYLCLLSPLLALLISIYAIIAACFITLLAPLCLCTSRKPIQHHLSTFLAPALHYQLRIIHSSYSPPNHGSTLPLLVVSILSPVYSIGVAAASVVAAIFWLYAAMLGNPDGARDDDGKAAVLGVRQWWVRWLVWGLSGSS